MALNRTKIGWTDFTWNPVTGCEHGCSYCYARRIARRFPERFNEFKPTFHEDKLDDPAMRKKPARIFVCSMADLFGAWVPDNWIENVQYTIRECPQHTFQLLTKNPARYLDFMPWPENAWLGVTATCNPDVADVSPYMQAVAPLTFLSVEPILGPTLLRGQIVPIWTPDWVIIGAQTGPGARLYNPRYVRDLTEQAKARGAAVFHKRSLGPEFQLREFPK